MDRQNKIILGIMAVALLLAFNIHQIKRDVIYRSIARAEFEKAYLPAERYMRGISFNKPVKMFMVKKGDRFIQWQVPNAPQGNFYGLYGSMPTELGINVIGVDPVTGNRIFKEMRVYIATIDFSMLSSYSAPVKDDWSTPEDETQTEGKKLQFFTTCKVCFERK